MPWLRVQQRLCLAEVREERQEPTGTILAMARRLGCMIIRNSQVLSKNGNEWNLLHFSRIHRTCWGLPGAWPGKEPSGCEDSDFPYYRSLYNPPRSWYHPGMINIMIPWYFIQQNVISISWFCDIDIIVLAVGIWLAILFNVKSGQRWIDELKTIGYG